METDFSPVKEISILEQVVLTPSDPTILEKFSNPAGAIIASNLIIGADLVRCNLMG